jgi:BirA family transcriptional regulator, biotin operon repressor / biotin---[acetyl-CoA-carboxylase] ligase
VLNEEEIRSRLQTRRFGRTLYCRESLDSTNAYARVLAEEGAPDGTIVLAEHQTAGRGRFGRSWDAPSGMNILCSAIVRPAIRREAFPLLAFYAAVATADAVSGTTGLQPECKWPNDLLLNGRKFCGILLESALNASGPNWAVIGIGLNANQVTFPSEWQSRATSLAIEAGAPVDRLELVCALCGSLERWEDVLPNDGMPAILEAWRSRSSMFGRTVTVTRGEEDRVGTAVALRADGGLLVQFPNGAEAVYAGDVTLTGSTPGPERP